MMNHDENKKNILIVDDSALMRRVICDIINIDGTFQASDVCRDGLEAYELLKRSTYDCVLLDVNMPKMNGLELLEKLQQDGIEATVIMVSTLTTADAATTILAIERGAVDFVAKPSNVIEAKGDRFKIQLIRVLTAVLSNDARPKKRTLKRPSTLVQPARPEPSEKQELPKAPRPLEGAKQPLKPSRTSIPSGKKLVALTSSTGGPKALQSVVPFLQANLDAPMVIVQHMPAGFTKSMAERLDELSGIRVKEAENNEILQKGVVYVAPGGRHLKVVRSVDGTHRALLDDAPAIGGLRPCANVMYESLRDCAYDEVVCVVLTGMGSDGTKGILSLKEKVPVYVISQDAASCVVYGMPKAIADSGATDEVVPLDRIAQTIMKNVGVK